MNQQAEERAARLGVIRLQEEEAKQVAKEARFRVKEFPEVDRLVATEICRLRNAEARAIEKCMIDGGILKSPNRNKKVKVRYYCHSLFSGLTFHIFM